MAIETRAYFRRLAHTGVGLLIGILSVCGIAAGEAAPPVTTGSVVIVPSDPTWGQIGKILFYQGNVLALDVGNGALYQLSPGATSWSTLVAGGGIFGTGFSAVGMAVDAQGTLYFGRRYLSTSNMFWRVPYDANQKTWHPTTSNEWGKNIIDPSTGLTIAGGADDVQWVDNPAMDGSGTLYWMTESTNNILSVPVNNTGNATQTSVTPTFIVTGLVANQGKMAVDVNGNIYFIENRATKNTGRVNGILFIPAGTTDIVGDLAGAAEAQLSRIDAPSNTIVYGGVTLDAAGNIYVTSESNSTYDETFNGIWKIPNECIGAKGVNAASCLNYNHISLLTPVGSNNPIAIDPRGYLWIPSYQDWTPAGSGPYPGVYAIVVWDPGALNLGVFGDSPTILSMSPNFGTAGSSVTISGMNFGVAQGTSRVLFNAQASTTQITSWSPGSITAVVPSDATTGNVVVTVGGVLQPDDTIVGGIQSNGLLFTVGDAGAGAVVPSSTVFVTFNQAVTPGGIQYSQAAGGTDFASATANPYPPISGVPAVPCTAGTAYTAQTSCQIWVGLNAHAPGAISGQLTMLDSSNNPIPGSTVYLSGTGQGAEVAMLGSPAQTAVAGAAAGLVSPAQVASDHAGNTYVADPGLRKVLMFPANTSGTAGIPIGSGLSAPTGVAVDGAGDVYIADSGSVIEIPAVNGVLNPAGTVTVASGLGSHLNLAVNGIGQAFVADPDNARVVMIPNPAAVDLVPNGHIAGVNASSTVSVSSNLTQPFVKPTAVAVDTAGNLFVADGSTLLQISPLSLGTLITNNLAGSVTGLAVDASGSVIVTQTGGILRIPSINGALTFNSASPVASSITAPGGVALDQQGNIYVSDMTDNTPMLYELAVTGSVDFGNALTPTEQATANVGLYNIGNLPLTVTGTPAFSGTGFDIADLALTTPTAGTPCDATGVTPVATGSSCTVGVGFTPPTKGVYSGDLMTVPTNAANIAGGAISASLQGTALENLEPTQTTVTPAPASSTFPGSTTVTVAVTPEPNAQVPATTNVPSGQVTVTLTCMNTGCTQAPIQQQGTATGDDTGTSAQFTFSSVPGGIYCVTASYAGSTTLLFKPSQSPDCAGTPNFTVTPTTPAITLSEPLGVSANSLNGIYYVQAHQTTITLTANISSPLGAPTGSVVFTNGTPLAQGGAIMQTAALDANGDAAFDTSSLAEGTYNIFANYGGDQNFQPAASSVITFQVVSDSGAVLITASPASVSTPGGTPVASTLTLQSLAGYSADTGANITCDNSTLPYYSECTFSVPQPVICAPRAGSPCTGITTTVLTISSNIPVNLPPSGVASAKAHDSGNSPLVPAGIFGLGLFGLALRRRAIFNRKLLNGAGLALMLIAVAMGFGGCTNSAYTKTPKVPVYTTPKGTKNVRILVTDPTKGLKSLPFTIAVTIQ